ncbi:MCE family protein [Nocardia otitidiscaviarum]|uniref:MCE family protein n=1 Tax=Nocardia otitidiscaviarum TaxID=1823 RepID=UPI001894BE42|nr:MCE family protein [Nocardia otitidiscaviarum]MBF6136964.1 MCE family protein [Nocardia otitidiscaviarum]
MPLTFRATLTTCFAVATLLTTSCSSPSSPIGQKRITADFRSIAGVFEGNPVTVLGVEVGRVDKVNPRSTFVEVHLSVDDDVELPKNVMAVLISPSLVTDRHIELTPRYIGGETLPDDAHLTVEATRTPVELDTMLQTIDEFAAALQPTADDPTGPLSGRVLHPLLAGQGEKLRDTLAALANALETGTANKDAIASIIIKLNELTTMLADNDQSVREFSDKITQMSTMLAEQAPGLQATLDQLDDVLSNTGGALGSYQDQLAGTLSGLTAVTAQLRANAAGITEVVDVAPLLFQNIDRSVNRSEGFIRTHVVWGTALSGEVISLFCERIELRSDGCRTGRMEDFGPDFGLTAALLGLTR